MIHPRAEKANYGSRDKCGSNRDQMASRTENMDYLTLYRKTHACPNPGSKERKGEPPAGDRPWLRTGRSQMPEQAQRFQSLPAAMVRDIFEVLESDRWAEPGSEAKRGKGANM